MTDLPAYLSLKFDGKQAAAAVGRLRKTEVTHRRANDILRACNLVPLPLDDPGVRRDLLNAVSGKGLSPVLVVSSGLGGDIADGYHRVSLAYHLDRLCCIECEPGSESWGPCLSGD